MARKPKVLIVDDEEGIRCSLSALLSDTCEPIVAEDGNQGIAIAKAENPDLILMDIIMPGISGLEAAQMLSQNISTKAIPILMLSAASSRVNRLSGYDNGADDFIAKPFDPEELVAKIHSKLRRLKHRKSSKSSLINIGGITIDRDSKEVLIGESRIDLTDLEFRLLSVIGLKQGNVVDRDEIAAKVWKNAKCTDRIIDVHIVALRKKIPLLKTQLVTVYGQGFKLKGDSDLLPSLDQV